MEQEFKRLLEEVRDVYFVIQDEKIAFVSKVMLEQYGYHPDELIGKSLIATTAPEARDQIMELHRRRVAGHNVPFRYETVLLAKDGTRVPAEVSVWFTQYEGRPAVAGILTNIAERKKRQAEIIKAQEVERERLAQALHDDTIQELLLISHRLQDIAAGTHGRLPKRARERLAEVRGLVERAMNEVRRFTHDLRPAILDDLGLVPALRWLTDRLADGDGLEAQVRVLGEERRLSREAELALFRIAQEALSNIRKHARASRAMVTLEFGAEKVTMSVSDDGRGFEFPPTSNHFASQGKLGLAGISARVQMLGGTHIIDSKPGKGTVVKVEVTRGSIGK